jgi:Short C-terminal domain
MPRRFLFLFVLVSAVAAACAANRTMTRPVLDDGYTVIRLETWLDDFRKPVPLGFDHPADIGKAEMARILESIRIVQPAGFLSRLILNSKSDPEPAFTTPEAVQFAKPLSEAFRTAAPDERIVFFLHHQRSLYKGTTTSGVAFVKDKRLNIILGRYLMGNQPGAPDIPVGGKPLPSTNEQDFFAVPGRFQSLIDERKAPGGNEMVFPRRWLVIDYASFLSAPPESAAPPSAEPLTEPGNTEPAPAAPPMTLEEKLKTLKDLQEKGLITEEEYNQKKQELLKSF